MRTPAVMIVGMVLAPCGLVLALTCTFAPDWRLLKNVPGKPMDYVEHQGIWDVCTEQLATQSTIQTAQARQCGLERPDYFKLIQVQLGRGLMLSSMAVTVLGIVLASIGVRCWQDYPSYVVAGLGGLVIFLSGVLSLIPISWYNYEILTLTTESTVTIKEVGYALVLGYIGSCFEIIGGASLALSLVHACQERLRARSKASPPAKYFSKKAGSGGVGNGLGPGGPPYYRDPGVNSSAYTPDYSIRRDTGGDLKRPQSVPWDNPPHRDYVSTVPRSHTNPMDVTAGEVPYGVPASRPRSQLSSLPCDSDLL